MTELNSIPSEKLMGLLGAAALFVFAVVAVVHGSKVFRWKTWKPVFYFPLVVFIVLVAFVAACLGYALSLLLTVNEKIVDLCEAFLQEVNSEVRS